MVDEKTIQSIQLEDNQGNVRLKDEESENEQVNQADAQLNMDSPKVTTTHESQHRHSVQQPSQP